MLEVGRITKPHGLRGEVIVELVTNRTERVDPGSVLHAGTRELLVVRSTPHHNRWIVAFDGVTDVDAAESLRGTVLEAEPLDDHSELWVHELIGSSVVDGAGISRGHVVSVISNPASDLLELEGGHLVPARFVVSSTAGQVVVEVPEGLFDT